ncbi:uncharacterized protein LY79DRAFT_130473 [Colletotrichum navitas]|uniref:Uncharacterized protein n=1 Tax=Colletotrichum navitas TaxID=681940 RepID=A0AAD8UYC5_9PEZI|nr:uncharacterized protein LY79DRAFT_130473 [Colletotrichum navitas]KAK1564282.1 hypothetical protein LY79DRAFT_130473 [Colletotrichum navitas]
MPSTEVKSPLPVIDHDHDLRSLDELRVKMDNKYLTSSAASTSFPETSPFALLTTLHSLDRHSGCSRPTTLAFSATKTKTDTAMVAARPCRPLLDAHTPQPSGTRCTRGPGPARLFHKPRSLPRNAALPTDHPPISPPLMNPSMDPSMNPSINPSMAPSHAFVRANGSGDLFCYRL